MIAARQHPLSVLIRQFMISRRAFDPATGAPLSDDKIYPDHYRFGVRSPAYHPNCSWIENRDQAFTNGELRSSREGLIGYFKRVHRACRVPDPRLDSAAALAITRLKTDDDDDQYRGEIDTFIWYALAERLARKGHWVSWMIDFAIPRCPHCYSEIRFEQGARLIAKCGSDGSHGMVHDDMLERVTTVYNNAFAHIDGAIDEPTLIR